MIQILAVATHPSLHNESVTKWWWLWQWIKSLTRYFEIAHTNDQQSFRI